MKGMLRLTLNLALIVAIGIALAPTLLKAPLAVEAQGIVQATVVPDRLIVRARPGINAAVLGTYAKGTVLAVEGREDQLGNGGIWVYGTPVGGGFTGWVLSDYLLFPSTFNVETLPVVNSTGTSSGTPGNDPAPVINAPAGTLAGSTLNTVNFRANPSTRAQILQTLPRNTPALFIGRNSSGTWFQAQVNGATGWLFGTLVTISGDRNSLPVTFEEPAVVSNPSPNVGSPVYSAANLRSFSYGAHVAGFNYPDLMAYAGMTWVKIQVRFVPGANPNDQAGFINLAHSRGFRVLLGVVGDAGAVLGGQDYFNAYAEYVGKLAALGADAIEIWNEPNIDRQWATGNINPATYTQLLATAYNAIKRNNAGTIVISGAPAPTGAEGAFGRARVWNDNSYLEGMRAAGAASYMDCVGAHYNEGIISPNQTSGDPRDGYYTRYFWGMVNTYYNIMRKPVCFTELGYLTPEGYGPLPGFFGWAVDTSLAEQAQWVADAVRLARGSGRVPLVIIWNMDFTDYGADPMAGYALVRPGGFCPACDRLAAQR